MLEWEEGRGDRGDDFIGGRQVGKIGEDQATMAGGFSLYYDGQLWHILVKASYDWAFLNRQ